METCELYLKTDHKAFVQNFGFLERIIFKEVLKAN